jgi:MGT family glycosyltransferase
MRVLFTTLPGAGMFHPHVPLARTLQEAGHEVAFAVAQSYCSTIETTGFRCFVAGYDWHSNALDRLTATVKSLRGDVGFAGLRDIFGTFLASKMVPDLLALAHSWRPDMILRDPMEFGGCVTAEALNIPHAASGPLFAFWDGAWHGAPGEVDRPELDELRLAYGLPPDPELRMLHRYLNLAFMPASFPNPALRPPPTVHYFSMTGFNQSGAEALPSWFASLPDRPTVHASLGTVFNRTPGVLAAIIEGLRNKEINLIVTVGPDQDPAVFGPQPPNVHIERYIPHALLLPRCDVMVTHCGFSTIMTCLEHGLPMVTVPLAGGDQPGNAARCATLGAARLVTPMERTPEIIGEAVMDVLREPRYRQNAMRLRREMQALPGPGQAVGLLERLVLEKAPIIDTGRAQEFRTNGWPV